MLDNLTEHDESQNIVVIAGSESYAFDIGRVAGGLAKAFLLRYTPIGDFNGSMFELYRFNGSKCLRTATLKVPLRAKGKVRRMISRPPFFVINTMASAAFAVKAVRTSKSGRTRTFAIGIGWGGALICLIMKYLRLVNRIVYYRVDWFVPIQGDLYSHVSVGFFRSLDSFLSSHSDSVWNLTEAIGNCSSSTEAKDRQDLVIIPPIRLPAAFADAGTSQFDPVYFVYFGEVKPGCGLPVILEAFDILNKSGDRYELRIIGRSRPEYFANLSRRFFHLFDDGCCKYLGPVDVGDPIERERLDAEIRSAFAGFAITPGGLSNTSNFALQNRVMIYVANCTPTIINEDSAVAKWLSARGLALSVDSNPDSIASTVRLIVGSKEIVQSLRSSIRQFLTKDEPNDMMREAILVLLGAPNTIKNTTPSHNLSVEKRLS